MQVCDDVKKQVEMTKCYKVESGAKMHQLDVHTGTKLNLLRNIQILVFEQPAKIMMFFRGFLDHYKTALG